MKSKDNIKLSTKFFAYWTKKVRINLYKQVPSLYFMNKKEEASWVIELTPEFKRTIKKHDKEKDFLQAFSKKITRLQEDPFSLGKELHGDLHSLSSTRILGKFRLIFKVDAPNKRIVLFDVDHRKDVYE